MFAALIWMDGPTKNYQVRYMSRVTSEYEKSWSRWDGEMVRDNERWVIGLEFSKKKYINYYYLSWVKLRVEPTPAHLTIEQD
jgi:hypothetical protein